MKLSNAEKGTIVLFNEEDANAEIYTHNPNLKKRFQKLSARCPELISMCGKTGGGMVFTLPKRMLTIMARAPISEREHNRRSAAVHAGQFTRKILLTDGEFQRNLLQEG